MEGTGAVDRIEISGEEGLKMEKKGIRTEKGELNRWIKRPIV